MDGKNPSSGGTTGFGGSSIFGGSGGLAGGASLLNPTPAGSATPKPMSYSPTPLPNTAPTAGSGAYWGPGSTYVPAYGQNPAELINSNKNAFVMGPNNQWIPAGINAQVPTGAPLPTAPGAAPNSTPGAAINPYFSDASLRGLQSQLDPLLSGGLSTDEITKTLSNYFGNQFSATSPNAPPPGGYRPGYAMPQNSIQYLPPSAVLNLYGRLGQSPIGTQQQLDETLRGWQQSLGQYPSTGVAAPTLSSTGAKK